MSEKLVRLQIRATSVVPRCIQFCARSSLRDLFGGFLRPELKYGRDALELAAQCMG
jgi:hypothetical protein